MKHIETPNIDKLHETLEFIDFAHEFIDWLLVQRGLCLTDADGNKVELSYNKIREEVLDFKGIDLSEVEKERKAVISYLNSITGSAVSEVRYGFGGF